jgi:hypothetical protein
MTDHAGLDAALEQVIDAARSHLAAVKAAGGAIDDEQVWYSYVALNNASYEYDQLLMEAFGEVTPWDTELIDAREDEAGEPAAPAEEPASDPYPSVVSVRQRRDYRVPSVAALLAAAEEATRALVLDDEVPAPGTVAEAVLGLVQAGDGSLAALDVPALEPLDGVVTVTEVAEPLDLASGADGADLFGPGVGDRLVGRLDEHPYLELDDELDDLEPLDGDEPGREGRD